MKFKAILCLLLLLLSMQAGAQQRKGYSNQRRTTTSVSKPTQSAITKTRQVGKDGFIWYKLKKGNLYGAADIEGKTLIPIEFSSLECYVDNDSKQHYFKVKERDFEGLYNRKGFCIIPTDRHFIECEIRSEKNQSRKLFSGVTCKSNSGQLAFFDIQGNEVVPSGDYEHLSVSFLYPTIMHIYYKQNGLWGAFDLNGNKIAKPCACAFINIYANKIEFVDNDNNRKTISGSYSEGTRFVYDPFRLSSSGSSSRTSSFSHSSSSSSSTSSSSSSSSSSHQQRQVWKERWRPCTACDPNRKGYCRYCHGQGGSYIGNIYNVCGICGGTGACTMCGGRGEYKETYSTWE